MQAQKRRMEEIFLLLSLFTIELNRKRWKSRNFTLILHLHSMVMHAIFVSCAIFFLFIKHNQPWFQFFFLQLFLVLSISYSYFSPCPIKKSLTFVRTSSDIHFSCESVGISSLILPPFSLVFFFLFLLFFFCSSYSF